MKKSIILLAVAFVCAGCPSLSGTSDADTESIMYSSTWCIENSTDQTLLIAPPPFGETVARSLISGEKVVFYSRRELGTRPDFDMLLVCWRDWAPEASTIEDLKFRVLSTDQTVLAEWGLYLYEYGYYNNFFDNSRWDLITTTGRDNAEWTFSILPEHILYPPLP